MEFTALRLFGFAIGAALQFSLLTLIRRSRKLEKLEILFLGLIACLFCWNFANFLLLLFQRVFKNPMIDWKSAGQVRFDALKEHGNPDQQRGLPCRLRLKRSARATPVTSTRLSGA